MERRGMLGCNSVPFIVHVASMLGTCEAFTLSASPTGPVEKMATIVCSRGLGLRDSCCLRAGPHGGCDCSGCNGPEGMLVPAGNAWYFAPVGGTEGCNKRAHRASPEAWQ
eukprot:5591801-Prymnesium_polylepis.1